MAIRAWPILLVMSAMLLAQQATTHSNAADYPAHSKLSSMEIGARYLPHGVPGGKAAYAGKEYLVVEVAIFPATRVAISKSQFTLRVDGDKAVLSAQSPGKESASLTVPPLEGQPDSSKGSIVLGGPPLPDRFPGDDRDQSRMPRSPIPIEPSQGSVQKSPSGGANTSTAKTALTEGPATKPVTGLLFYRFDGDAKSIRSLELVYDGGGVQKARLRLL